MRITSKTLWSAFWNRSESNIKDLQFIGDLLENHKRDRSFTPSIHVHSHQPVSEERASRGSSHRVTRLKPPLTGEQGPPRTSSSRSRKVGNPAVGLFMPLESHWNSNFHQRVSTAGQADEETHTSQTPGEGKHVCDRETPSWEKIERKHEAENGRRTWKECLAGKTFLEDRNYSLADRFTGILSPSTMFPTE